MLQRTHIHHVRLFLLSPVRSASCVSSPSPRPCRGWAWWCGGWGKDTWTLTWKELRRSWPASASSTQVWHFSCMLKVWVDVSSLNLTYLRRYTKQLTIKLKQICLASISRPCLLNKYSSLQSHTVSQRLWRATPGRASGSLPWLIDSWNPNSPGTKSRASAGTSPSADNTVHSTCSDSWGNYIKAPRCSLCFPFLMSGGLSSTDNWTNIDQTDCPNIYSAATAEQKMFQLSKTRANGISQSNCKRFTGLSAACGEKSITGEALKTNCSESERV